MTEEKERKKPWRRRRRRAGWISAAGSAGCSSSDALLSQHLPGPCSHVCPIPVPCPMAATSPGAAGGSFLVSLLFSPGEVELPVTRIFHCRFPMGS